MSLNDELQSSYRRRLHFSRTMDYQLKEARLKYDREQQEKKDAARRRIERERRAREAAEKRRAEVEENQRLRRLEEAERHEMVRSPVYLRTMLRVFLFSCTEYRRLFLLQICTYNSQTGISG